MLRGIHKASTTWLGKVVLGTIVGTLVIAFAIWGIGDVFRGFGRSTALKVGGTEVGIEAFRQLYNDRLQQYSRQFGRPITIDQARALGLDRLAVSQIIGDYLLDEQARRLGLNVSDAELVAAITKNPAFLGPTGQFDRFRFEQIIRQAGYTEARFMQEERRQMLRRQLGGSVVGGPNVPKSLIEAVNRYQNEQRSVEYILIDRAQAGEIPAPTPEALQKYYDDRKILFRAPEYRKVVVVSLLPAEQAQWIEVSDADARRAYEERRNRYVTPERRHLNQLVFPKLEDAQAAADRIAKGASFAEIAKERGVSEKDYDLGLMTKAAVIDRAIADAAFALKEGEVSAPVQGRFGTALVQVLKIEPEKVRSFEEVAPELKRELGTERAKNQILDLYDKIEKERGDGKTLAEAASALKIATRTIEAIDRSGRDPTGAQVTGIPDAQRVLTTIFQTEVGADRDPLQFQDGYVWYDVTVITPARERPFEEVKDQVEERWREQEISTRLKSKAAEILDKLKSGATFADVAAANNLKVETATGLKRSEAGPPFSSTTIDAIFRTGKDNLGTADAAVAVEQIVFRVTDVVTPPLDVASDEAKRIRDALNRAISDDLLSEYIARLEADIGVTINTEAVTRIITGGSGAETN